jgi:hypothetical protein
MMQQLRNSASKFISAVVLLLLFTAPQQVNAAIFSVDGISYRELTDNTCEVSKNLYSGDVNIPEMVTYEDKTYTVTAIGYEAFSMCSDLTLFQIQSH